MAASPTEVVLEEQAAAPAAEPEKPAAEDQPAESEAAAESEPAKEGELALAGKRIVCLPMDWGFLEHTWPEEGKLGIWLRQRACGRGVEVLRQEGHDPIRPGLRLRTVTGPAGSVDVTCASKEEVSQRLKEAGRPLTVSFGVPGPVTFPDLTVDPRTSWQFNTDGSIDRQERRYVVNGLTVSVTDAAGKQRQRLQFGGPTVAVGDMVTVDEADDGNPVQDYEVMEVWPAGVWTSDLLPETLLSHRKSNGAKKHQMSNGRSCFEISKQQLDEEFERSSKSVFCLYFASDGQLCQWSTDELVKLYNNGLRDGAEIIFVSSDKDAGWFDGCYANMPWLAMKFDDPAKHALAERFGLGGLTDDSPPVLMVFKGNEEVVSYNAEESVSGETDPKKVLRKWGVEVPDDDIKSNDDDGDDDDGTKCDCKAICKCLSCCSLFCR